MQPPEPTPALPVGVRKFQALAAAACDPRFARGDIAVLAVILQHANSHTGAAWPGVNRIAAIASLDRSSAMRSITKLERAGLVEVDRSKRGRSNTYRPKMPTGGVDATSGISATGGVGAPELVAPMRLELVAPTRPESRKSEYQQEPLKARRASAAGDDGFSAFWASYPKKVERLDAVKAWSKLNGADRHAATADVARRVGGEWAATEAKFILGPARYLRGRRWEDEPVQPPPAAPPSKRPDALRRDFTAIDYTAGLQEVAAP